MPTTADLFCMVLLLFVGLTCFFLKGYLLPEEPLDYHSLWQCSRWENILIHFLKCFDFGNLVQVQKRSAARTGHRQNILE